MEDANILKEDFLKMLIAEILPNEQISLSDTVVADSIKHQKVKFVFSPEWEKYEKTAIFSNDSETYNVVLNSENNMCISENECYIPFEVLKPPYFTVSVFGVSGESRITTTKANVKVLESGYKEGEVPKDPTPDVYSQLLQIVATIEELARSVREDADNGVFIGQEGPKGEKGEKGDRGEDGKDGRDGQNGKDGRDGKDGLTQIIDQNYNPESENGQSGKAVAEAVKNKQGKFATLLYEDESQADVPTGIKFDYWNPVLKTSDGLVLNFNPITAGINSTFYVNEPLLDGHAATKSYVDNAIYAVLNSEV